MGKIVQYPGGGGGGCWSETYTIWMKSLVLNSNGYTVYDSSGQVVFRIDNYDSKSRPQVYLMDLPGNIVCTIILRKKVLRLISGGLRVWECYKQDDSSSVRRRQQRLPWFSVRKSWKNINYGSTSSVYDVLSVEDSSSSCCKIIKMEASSSVECLKIMDGGGRVAAVVRRKRSSSGVELGQDVLCVTIEPHVDHVFIMALVAINGLILGKM